MPQHTITATLDETTTAPPKSFHAFNDALRYSSTKLDDMLHELDLSKDEADALLASQKYQSHRQLRTRLIAQQLQIAAQDHAEDAMLRLVELSTCNQPAIARLACTQILAYAGLTPPPPPPRPTPAPSGGAGNPSQPPDPPPPPHRPPSRTPDATADAVHPEAHDQSPSADSHPAAASEPCPRRQRATGVRHHEHAQAVARRETAACTRLPEISPRSSLRYAADRTSETSDRSPLVFSNSRKMAQATAQRLIAGHVTLVAWWALKHAGVLEAMREMEEKSGGKEGLDPLVHATKANMSPEVLAGLVEYLGKGGLVVVKEGQAYLTAEGKGLLEHEDGLLEVVRSYEPVLGAVEHLLARLRTSAVASSHRKTESLAQAQAARYAGEVFPAIEEAVKKYQLEHLLDLNCGEGDLLIYLAERVKHSVGVGIGGDGFLVRKGNQAITAAGLEKRLIQVTANPVEACVNTKRTFDRIGISEQLWGELDGVIAVNLFAEPGARDAESSVGSVVKTLSGLGRHFPKAHVLLLEPTMGARWEKNFYAGEMSLLMRLCGTTPWGVEMWRGAIGEAGMTVEEEVGLGTDGMVMFVLRK